MARREVHRIPEGKSARLIIRNGVLETHDGDIYVISSAGRVTIVEEEEE